MYKTITSNAYYDTRV